MIKEYKTKSQRGPMTGSVSFKSNASTKAFQNEEIQRINKIMNEPIDNLIINMGAYSRPVSSSKHMTNLSQQNFAKFNKSGVGMPSLKMKKERAMTAHHKPNHAHAFRNRKLGGDHFQSNTMQNGRELAPKSAVNHASGI